MKFTAAAIEVIKFVAGFFQENRPESFSRGITVIIVAFVVGWDSAYLHWTHTLPDVLTMGAQAAFMTVFYFGGKGLSTYADVKKSQGEQQ